MSFSQILIITYGTQSTLSYIIIVCLVCVKFSTRLLLSLGQITGLGDDFSEKKRVSQS